jgi:hypothetical protein
LKLPSEPLQGHEEGEPAIELFLGSMEIEVRSDDQFCLLIELVVGILQPKQLCRPAVGLHHFHNEEGRSEHGDNEKGQIGEEHCHS